LEEWFLTLQKLYVRTKPVMSKGFAAATWCRPIKMGHPAIIPAWPHIQAGTVRPLAVALKERDRFFPLPLRMQNWDIPLYCPRLGVSGPPKLPSHIVQIWSKVYRKWDPEYLALIQKHFRTFFHTPKEMVEYIKKESEMAKLVYGVKK
jgi:tripartite-type tricarboxylate transporter receptor subunit TctC